MGGFKMSKGWKFSIVLLIFVIILGIFVYKKSEIRLENAQYDALQQSNSKQGLENEELSKEQQEKSLQDEKDLVLDMGDVAVVNNEIKEERTPDNIIKEDKTQLPILLDFGADWCEPCKRQKPILLDLKKEYEEKVDIQIIDVDEERERATEYKIKLIPTQIFIDQKGNQIYRHEGLLEKTKILEKFREMGIE